MNKFCEAEADALRAAIEFRKGLESSGIAKAKRVENPQSGVKGVNWDIQQKAWKVRLKANGKRLHGGTSKPKDSTPEEVERARLAAVESRRKLEEKYFTMEKITMKQIANKKQQEKTICTSMLLCIYMHGESGCDSEVNPIVKLIWSKFCITIYITIAIISLITIWIKCAGDYGLWTMDYRLRTTD